VVQVQSKVINLGLLLSSVSLLLSIAFYFQASQSTYIDAKTVADNYYMAANGDVLFSSKVEKVSDIFLLEVPVKSMIEVAQWAARVSTDLFTVDFFSYQDHFEGMKNFFTDEGWKSINQAIYQSGWLSDLIDKKLTASAVLVDTPIILNHGSLNGFYNWTFSFPLLVSYESASERGVKERRSLIVQVRRIPTDFSQGKAGIAIESIESSKVGI
jgi:hypothetical protein